MATLAEALQLALAHQHGGRLREAEAAYREILARDPGHVEALNNLGNLLQNGGQLDAAIGCFERALALRPDLPPLHFNLANALWTGDFHERAMAGYRQALALEPNFAAGYNNLGMVQKDMGDLDGAMRSLEEAIRVDPNYADAHYNLGWVKQERGDPSGAEASYRRSIELRPEYAPAHFRMGLVYQAGHDWELARRHFLEALRIRPQYAEPQCCLGLIHLSHGEDEQALEHFERALEIDPECPEAHYNRGVVLLSRGDYEAGWPEYAWRRRCFPHRDPKFDRPAWDGSPLAGRTLLINCNYGLGDTLQFARYVPEARKRGAGRVLLATHDALHPLLAESGFGELVSLEAKDLEFDCYVSVMDLPYVFRSTDETIPPAPYLCASAPAVAKWAETLSRLDGYRIGIAWQGDRDYGADHWRSIPLAQFEPLARVPGVRLISLQKGDGVEQLADAPFPVEKLGEAVDKNAAFWDTAAVIKNLELVITSDTAVAHLAGALGAPLWLALSVSPDWRWMLGRDDSPWYPTMRLFRQTKLGDWPGVFARMAAKLNSMTLSRRANH